ncbi:hypothetical protein GSI_00315 [Ganoderma sinense ZZ0214-1]|uniref:Uncharacterized protein n=1 Tax=Ganoderma sinense ZZ0214-1 TaxID=1077348 RepID=A0A2G8SS77_9APHY|nr:hypothetical protein GSI_00315 [Ganoderma sinense ZZ0214-1]
MSQPPPYGPPSNPDRRPLPQGWIEKYDERYQAWFYVNTLENPPRSSWVHPLGAAPPEGYGPPSGPPPPNQYNNPYPPPGGYNQGPLPQQQWGQSPPPPSGGYYGGPPPPQGGYPGQYGGPPPGQGDRGWFGSNTPQPQQQPAYVEQRPPKKSGPGMGTALLAGGAGLVGGALLMDAFENHEEHEREEAYDAGYNQGFDNGFDQGEFDDGGGW